jgi:hypothetical protein
MAARLETITEAKKSTEEASSYLKAVERIYGTDSPEAITATEILKNALKGVKDEAKREALEEMSARQREAQEAEQHESARLDAMLEELEDEFNVDLTSKKAKELREGFFKRLERLSPKDENGDIIQYADHRAVWEDYSNRLQKRTETRAKEVSDRSMQQSTSATANKSHDPNWEALKQIGF